MAFSSALGQSGIMPRGEGMQPKGLQPAPITPDNAPSKQGSVESRRIWLDRIKIEFGTEVDVRHGPAQLEEIHQRLSAISRLQKRFGLTLDYKVWNAATASELEARLAHTERLWRNYRLQKDYRLFTSAELGDLERKLDTAYQQDVALTRRGEPGKSPSGSNVASLLPAKLQSSPPETLSQSTFAISTSPDSGRSLGNYYGTVHYTPSNGSNGAMSTYPASGSRASSSVYSATSQSPYQQRFPVSFHWRTSPSQAFRNYTTYYGNSYGSYSYPAVRVSTPHFGTNSSWSYGTALPSSTCQSYTPSAPVIQIFNSTE